MSAPDADANPSTMFESKAYLCADRNSVANVTRTQIVVGMSESKPPIEKIKLRKLGNGTWRVSRPDRDVWDCHKWADAHQIMIRLVNSDIRVAATRARGRRE